MKKLVLMVTILGLTGAVYGCGGSSDTSNNNSTTQEQQENSSEEVEEVEEPVATDSGNLGDYYVEIKDCAFGQDYEGNKMIVINYNFTNNSDENAAAIWSLNQKAFQDGIQLETAIAMDDTVYNAETAMKEVQKGITIENCQIAYVLTSDSPVEFEMSELISVDDTKLSKTFDVQ